MSVGPTGGIAASAMGSPLAQTSGSEVERAAQDAAAQSRHVQSSRRADSAAGVGETNGEDHETEERDADGRRLWEENATQSDENAQETPAIDDRRAKDPSGQCGNLLDLTG